MLPFLEEFSERAFIAFLLLLTDKGLCDDVLFGLQVHDGYTPFRFFRCMQFCGTYTCMVILYEMLIPFAGRVPHSQ